MIAPHAYRLGGKTFAQFLRVGLLRSYDLVADRFNAALPRFFYVSKQANKLCITQLCHARDVKNSWRNDPIQAIGDTQSALPECGFLPRSINNSFWP